MEEDIKILEEIKEGTLKASECSLTSISESNHWKREAQAIENIIKRYKELEQENEKLEEKRLWQNKERRRLEGIICDLQDELSLYKKDLGEFYKSSEEQLKNSVPKSKIEEKIKDLESKKDIKDNTTYTFKEVEEVIIQVLQELLEWEENK